MHLSVFEHDGAAELRIVHFRKHCEDFIATQDPRAIDVAFGITNAGVATVRECVIEPGSSAEEERTASAVAVSRDCDGQRMNEMRCDAQERRTLMTG